MPRKRSRRNRRNPKFVAIPIATAVALGTLASATATTVTLTPTGNFTHDIRVHSVSLHYSRVGGVIGEGPVVVGLAHSDYTGAEIEENLELALLGPATKIENERADRLVRPVGVLEGATAAETLNDGKPVKTRLNWMIHDGVSIDLFVYNESGSQLTDGSDVKVRGTLYGTWS